QAVADGGRPGEGRLVVPAGQVGGRQTAGRAREGVRRELKGELTHDAGGPRTTGSAGTIASLMLPSRGPARQCPPGTPPRPARTGRQGPGWRPRLRGWSGRPRPPGLSPRPPASPRPSPPPPSARRTAGPAPASPP